MTNIEVACSCEHILEVALVITSSTVVDLGQSPWWDIVRAPWQDTLQKPSGDFASAVAKNMPKCEKAIADLMSRLPTGMAAEFSALYAEMAARRAAEQ